MNALLSVSVILILVVFDQALLSPVREKIEQPKFLDLVPKGQSRCKFLKHLQPNKNR